MPATPTTDAARECEQDATTVVDATQADEEAHAAYMEATAEASADFLADTCGRVARTLAQAATHARTLPGLPDNLIAALAAVDEAAAAFDAEAGPLFGGLNVPHEDHSEICGF